MIEAGLEAHSKLLIKLCKYTFESGIAGALACLKGGAAHRHSCQQRRHAAAVIAVGASPEP